MPIRLRRIVTFVPIAWLLLIASASTQPQQDSGRDTTAQTAQIPQSPEAGAAKSATTYFAPGYKIDRDTYRVVCDQPKDKDHADLCQQWRMAEAAESQILLNIAGVVLLLATLIFTAIAAVAARSSVVAMQDTARQQLRAYVNAEPLGINPFSPSNEVVGHVAFHNTGQTWAKNVSMFVDIKHDLSHRLDKDAFPIGGFVGEGIIGPRAKRPTGTRAIPVPKGGGWLYVWGAVRYDDGFTKGRMTRFCHRYPCEKLSPAPEGGSTIDVEHARYHENSNDAD